MTDKRWYRLWSLALYLDGPATIRVGENPEEVVLIWPDGEITRATWNSNKDDWDLSNPIRAIPIEYGKTNVSQRI